MIDEPKRIREFTMWSTILLGILILLVISIHRKQHSIVEDVRIEINEIQGDRNLITEKEVLNIFRAYLGYSPQSANLKELDLRTIEQVISDDERVKSVEIYIDASNRLNVVIQQKQPIVRIFDDSSTSYYLDEEGDKISVRKGVAVRVPIATGHIELYNKALIDGSAKSALEKVLYLANEIHKDEYLTALVEQIDVSPEKEIALIPKIGRQKILIGGIENFEEKVYKLKLMYRDGLPSEGWRKYSVLKLNYRGSVYAEF